MKWIKRLVLKGLTDSRGGGKGELKKGYLFSGTWGALVIILEELEGKLMF